MTIRHTAYNLMQSGPGRVSRAAGFTLVELLIVVVIIGILAAIALPNYTKLKAKAKEAEANAGLHNIQLDVERFAVDDEGNYPKYLVGGDNAYLSIGDRADLEIGHLLVETDEEFSADPMIRNGYLECYPRNPFVRSTRAIQLLQAEYSDPLRSAFPDSKVLGTRFGAYGNVMGQVLCDPRYLTWSKWDEADQKYKSYDTWVNIQYKFYDTWLSNKPRPYLPGSFMYKAMGDIYANTNDSDMKDDVKAIGAKVKTQDNRGKAVLPANTNHYVLGVWGSLLSKGKDVLGEEPMVLFRFKGSMRGEDSQMFIYDEELGEYGLPTLSMDNYHLIGIPSWTRGVNRSHVGPLWGAPYGPPTDSSKQLETGNPNGIRDGIILVLTPGTTFEE
jgi:prepilin-type N-terminal cleavage/methylation domain-containing protein